MVSKAKKVGFVAIKAVVLMLLTAAIFALSCSSMADDEIFKREYLSEHTLNVFLLIFFLLIFNSLSIAINRYDKYARARFLEAAKNNKFLSRVKFTASSFDVYLEIGCIALLSFALPSVFSYDFVGKVFFGDLQNKLYTLLIVLPVLFVILFFAHVSVQKNWYISEQRARLYPETQKKPKIPPVIMRVVRIAFIYCVGEMALLAIMPVLRAFWDLGGIMLFVWIIVAIIAVFLCVIAGCFIRALVKRLCFVRKLKRYCADNAIGLSAVKNAYRSIFFRQDGFDFTIEKDKVRCDCKFMASVFPKSLLILGNNGSGEREDVLQIFGAELMRFLTKLDFAFESANKKVLLLLPTPKTFFISINGSKPTLADNGEKVGEYTVYTATGFFNAMEYDTL